MRELAICLVSISIWHLGSVLDYATAQLHSDLARIESTLSLIQSQHRQ